ncbi:hypothetical protein C8A00DRAFT_37487 [Chaetomidium leptoderma]|uniref:Uncharacterized protein n=1 Tax=Chaetomidium leptoderma TaxID=669021 RepID=A0AAN6VF40_9PEZI|nr:hypothetical protein C8A00DRAFT_37487 [Chaetomidium leptoderma]
MPSTSAVGSVFLVHFWLFQVMVAVPTFVLLLIAAKADLDDWRLDTFYVLAADLIAAGLTAHIILITLSELWLPAAGKRLTFWLELAKSLLATAMWIGLVADAKWNYRRNYHGGYWDWRHRWDACLASVIIPCMVFYPATIFAACAYWCSRECPQQRESGEEGGPEERSEESERTPLLRDEAC